MSLAFPNLFQPLRLGSLTLANRIVVGSMHTRLEQVETTPDRLVAFYETRARTGPAMIITGGYSPNADGTIEDESARLDSPDQIEFHRAIVGSAHRHNVPILLQILHAGRYGRHGRLVGASDIPSPINRRTPRVLTTDEVWSTIADFERCAALAKEAGYDGVEIMGSEGYLLTQFLCARTNTRDDVFGGNLDNRMRLSLEIVRRVRTRCGPDFVVVFRVSSLDLVDNGMTGEEILAFARALQDAGTDGLDNGVGWHEARVPTTQYSVPRGAWREATRRLKQAVAIPVMATNRLPMPDLAEKLIADGDADLVSLARPFLADPEYALKAREGRADEINTCIACNQACIDFIFRDKVSTCVVNPKAAHETILVPAPVVRKKSVAVVGAGAAGLACALEAAQRGHRVTLFEAGARVGGQMLLAMNVPGKEFAETIRYFETRLRRLGVDVRTGTAATIDGLAGGAFDEIVIATGATARRPAIEGLGHPAVAWYGDILSGRRIAGHKVLIVGAGGIGHDVAAYLTAPVVGSDDFLDAWGADCASRSGGGLKPPATQTASRDVTLLQRGPKAKGPPGLSTGWVLKSELTMRGVKVRTGVAYGRIDDAGLHLSTENGPETLQADTIVICAGQESDRGLHDALVSRGLRPHLIGGAEVASELDALRAIEAGTRLGLNI